MTKPVCRWIIDPEVERIFFCLCAHSTRFDPIFFNEDLGPYWWDCLTPWPLT